MEVTTQREKNPGRVEAGKKLAQRNKELKQQKTIEVQKTTYYGMTAGVLALVLGAVVLIRRTKNKPKSKPENKPEVPEIPKKEFDEFYS